MSHLTLRNKGWFCLHRLAKRDLLVPAPGWLIKRMRLSARFSPSRARLVGGLDLGSAGVGFRGAKTKSKYIDWVLAPKSHPWTTGSPKSITFGSTWGRQLLMVFGGCITRSFALASHNTGLTFIWLKLFRVTKVNLCPRVVEISDQTPTTNNEWQMH